MAAYLEGICRCIQVSQVAESRVHHSYSRVPGTHCSVDTQRGSWVRFHSSDLSNHVDRHTCNCLDRPHMRLHSGICVTRNHRRWLSS